MYRLRSQPPRPQPYFAFTLVSRYTASPWYSISFSAVRRVPSGKCSPRRIPYELEIGFVDRHLLMVSTVRTDARNTAPNPLTAPKRQLPKFKKTPALPAHAPATSQAAPQPTASSSCSLQHSMPKKAAPPDLTVAVEWEQGTGLLGFCTTYRPPDSRPGIEKNVSFGRDGLWAWHEYTRQPQLLDHTAAFTPWIKIPTADEARNSLSYGRAAMRDVSADPEPIQEGQDAAVDLKSIKGGEKFKRGMGSVNGMYRTTDALHLELETRYKALQNECHRATFLFRRAASTKMGCLDSGSVVRRIISDLREPTRELLDLAHTYFDICWTAHQRASAVVQAYIDFIGSLLPEGSAPSLAHQTALTPKTSRRGVVLADKDIDTYLMFFKRHEIPVWAYVALDQFDIPKDALGPADASRCDVSDCNYLSNQKELPIRWYPPPAVAWSLLEATARGYLPRPDEETFERGDQATNQKRQRVALDNKLAKVQREFGNLGTSLERYQQLRVRSPAARSYYANRAKPRPSYAPVILSEYAAAEHEAGRYIDLLATPLQHILDENDPGFFMAVKVDPTKLQKVVAEQLEQRAIRSFIPPLHVFTGAKSWDKTISMVVATVRMLPLLLARVKLARTDPHVVRLRPKDWKAILTREYWYQHWMDEQRIQHITKTLQMRTLAGEEFDEVQERLKMKDVKIQFEHYDYDVFWKYGSRLVFGEAESNRLKSTADAQPEFGELLCGCKPTYELLHKDPDLVFGLLTWFNQLRLAHWLADLVPSALDKEGIPGGVDSYDAQCTPDFTDEFEVQKPTVALIQSVVMHKQFVHEDCFPEGSSEELDDHAWLKSFSMILTRADYVDVVDQYMAGPKGWIPASCLRENDFCALNERECLKVEEHLYLRYFLTSFAAKQWPVEMHFLPTASTLRCSNCRTARQPQNAGQGVPSPVATGMAALFQNDDAAGCLYDEGCSGEDLEREGYPD
ncbi:hypothetical protein PENSPDRAFT_671414 [Peniophora sp. CONT]|nr:hypothetical protein PENSPDRAFT_671414 [Peniophora sp. CONT]